MRVNIVRAYRLYVSRFSPKSTHLLCAWEVQVLKPPFRHGCMQPPCIEIPIIIHLLQTIFLGDKCFLAVL